MSASAARPNAIVLVGSTGNGKSTLGSFLSNPETSYSNPIFPRATGPQPMTKVIQQHRGSYDTLIAPFAIIDTPGLNESDEADAQHALDLVQHLRDVDVACVVVCVNHDMKVDKQFELTISYYCNLLQSCLSRNFLIVVTNDRKDQRTLENHADNKYDNDGHLKTIRDKVKTLAGLDFDPTLWSIDAFVNPKYGDEHALAVSARHVILTDIQQMPPMSLKDLEFVKTESMVAEDERLICEFEGKIAGYDEALVQTQTLSEEISAKITSLAKRRAAIWKKLAKAQAILADIDVDKNVQVGSQPLSASWTVLKGWNEVSVDLKSKFDITHCRKTKPSRFTWELKEETRRVHGKVIGEWFAGIQAQVTIFSNSRDVNADRISGLSMDIASHVDSLTPIDTALDELKTNANAANDKMTSLWQYLDELKSQITILKCPYLPLEDAVKRISAVQ